VREKGGVRGGEEEKSRRVGVERECGRGVDARGGGVKEGCGKGEGVF